MHDSMRFADAPTTHAEIHVAAAPARVWELVTDIELPARHSPELHRVEWLDGATGPALGARFAGFNKNPKLGEWRTVSQVVEFAPEQTFTWCPMDADGRYGEPTTDPAKPIASWSFTLAPEGNGTRLRHSVTIGPGQSGVTVAIRRWPDLEEKIVAGRLADLRAAMETTLDGIKRLAEQPAD